MTNEAIQERHKLEQGEFEYFRQFLQQACGIFLGENKQYLVATRIRGILLENNLDSLTAVVDEMKRSRHSRLREKVIDAMTTNETFWFRDNYPFEYLKNTLLEQLQAQPGAGSIRIWSAACSSGQEPYSISMAVEEHRRRFGPGSPRAVQIVATDLSNTMLAQALRGEYDNLSLSRGLSAERLQAFFDQCGEDRWRLKPAVRERIDFRALNLMDPFVGLGKFDIIYCRNVLIYFSGELKRDILRRLHGALKPGGLLFLGSSEGLAGETGLFEMVHCNPGIVYREKGKVEREK